MSKNWLIRTQTRQILGPVPKEKILELIGSKKLKDEDEICSGNGYWIFIREKDLIDKYLKGDVPQGFNPISEAQSVLTGNDKQTAVFTLANLRGHIKEGGDKDIPQDKMHYPQSEDLEYPEAPVAKKVEQQADGANYPKKEDLEYPSPQKKN